MKNLIIWDIFTLNPFGFIAETNPAPLTIAQELAIISDFTDDEYEQWLDDGCPRLERFRVLQTTRYGMVRF